MADQRGRHRRTYYLGYFENEAKEILMITIAPANYNAKSSDVTEDSYIALMVEHAAYEIG